MLRAILSDRIVCALRAIDVSILKRVASISYLSTEFVDKFGACVFFRVKMDLVSGLLVVSGVYYLM